MSAPPRSDRDRLRQTQRVVVGLLGLSAGLAVAVVVLSVRGNRPDGEGLATVDPEVRDRVVQQLVEDLTDDLRGAWDSHPDAEVGRTLLPRLQNFGIGDHKIASNRYGIRERQYELPKPGDTLRVVLLGDSFIFGSGVEADVRLGVHLENSLRQRGQWPGPVECLHIGCISWNIASEEAFLRRQLSELDPDLVLHVIVANDLDDSASARGFGSLAAFSSLYRHRANGFLRGSHPLELGGSRQGFLPLGLDRESLDRYADNADRLTRLASAVGQHGSGYLLLVRMPRYADEAHHHLLGGVSPEQKWILAPELMADLRYQISETDQHWSPEGHERIACFLYGLILERDLLPDAKLSPWETATELVEQGRWDESRLRDPSERAARLIRRRGVRPQIDFSDLGEAASQIHGGIDREGFVAPYASLVLPRSGSRLRIEGRLPDRPELRGHVEFVIDGVSVHRLALTEAPEFELELEIPALGSELPLINLRLISDDHYLRGQSLRQCVALQLKKVSVID